MPIEIDNLKEVAEGGLRNYMIQSIADGISFLNKEETDESIEAKAMSCAEFSAKYLKTEKDIPIDFKTHPYLIDLYNDLSPEQVYMKASQVCITSMFMNKMIYMPLKESFTVIFTLPTSDDVQKLSSARFNPAVRFSSIRKFFKMDIDNSGVKQINSSYVYFKGTWNIKQAISVPSDLNIHDELNFSKPDIIGTYESRLGASKFKGTWLASTPTFTKTLIDGEFEDSNQTYWLIPCSHCGEEQHIVFEHITKRKRKKGTSEYMYACQQCGKEITEDDKLHGNWVSSIHWRRFMRREKICMR